MSADEAREQRGEILREIHHGLSFYADGMAYFAGAGWRAIWKDGGAEARKALDALDRLKRQEEKPRCEFGCVDGLLASKRGPLPCPDCSPAEKPDEDWPGAILTLRRAMCCRAGREQVERELIRPFGYVALSQAVWGELDRKWSRPVEIALKDGKLLIREPSPAPTTGDTE